jgi:hypothetical protein
MYHRQLYPENTPVTLRIEYETNTFPLFFWELYYFFEIKPVFSSNKNTNGTYVMYDYSYRNGLFSKSSPIHNTICFNQITNGYEIQSGSNCIERAVDMSALLTLMWKMRGGLLHNTFQFIILCFTVPAFVLFVMIKCVFNWMVIAKNYIRAKI